MSSRADPPPAVPDDAPPAHEAAERRDWVRYFDRMEGKPPRDTLRRAIDAFAKAVDIPTAKATDSVPGRNPCCWWPPNVNGETATPWGGSLAT